MTDFVIIIDLKKIESLCHPELDSGAKVKVNW